MFRLRFSLSTLIIATLFAGGVYGLWWRGTDAWTCERVFRTGQLRPSSGSGQYNVAAISSDNRLLAATSNEQKLRFFSVLNGATLWSVDLIGSSSAHRLRFLDEDRVIEIQCLHRSGEDQKHYYLDSQDGRMITDAAQLRRLENMSSALQWTLPLCCGLLMSRTVRALDGKRTLVCDRVMVDFRFPGVKYDESETFSVLLTDSKTGNLIAKLPSTLSPWATQFSPDGKRFAVGTFRQVFVREDEDGYLLAALETGRWNLHLEFSHDGEYLAIVHPDSVSLWQRHWPEAWWGHFCRFEVWLTIITGSVLAWRFCAAVLKALTRFARVKQNIPEPVRA
jgi:hypothetical protein